jgi:hypothetical protein
MAEEAQGYGETFVFVKVKGDKTRKGKWKAAAALVGESLETWAADKLDLAASGGCVQLAKQTRTPTSAKGSK